MTEYVADLQQRFIAGVVAVGVIDRFEAVEIDHHEGERRRDVERADYAVRELHVLGLPQCLSHLRFDELIQEAPVLQTGEGVPPARLLELIVERLELFVASHQLQGAGVPLTGRVTPTRFQMPSLLAA